MQSAVGVKFEQIYIEGVRSRVLGASEGHTSRVACRAIGPQGVCGASTWSHYAGDFWHRTY